MSEDIVVALISFTGTIIASIIGAIAISRKENSASDIIKSKLNFQSYFGIIFGIIGCLLIVASSFLPWGTFGKFSFSLDGTADLSFGISQMLSDKTLFGMRADLFTLFTSILSLILFLVYWSNYNKFLLWLTLVIGLITNSIYIFFLNPTNQLFGTLEAGAGTFLAGSYIIIISSVILKEHKKD